MPWREKIVRGFACLFMLVIVWQGFVSHNFGILLGSLFAGILGAAVIIQLFGFEPANPDDVDG